MEGLDKDKKERDRQIEETNKLKQQKKREGHGGDAVPHRVSEEGDKGRGRMVRDPTTGKEVEIEDVDKEFTQSVQDPQVRLIHFYRVLFMPFLNWGREADSSIAFGPECQPWEIYGKESRAKFHEKRLS